MSGKNIPIMPRPVKMLPMLINTHLIKLLPYDLFLIIFIVNYLLSNSQYYRKTYFTT